MNLKPEHGDGGGLGRAPLSAAVEDYLKAIYDLGREKEESAGAGAGVTTLTLARELGVSAPSATAMVKKLAQMHLAQHTPYRGVELSAAGEKIALEIIRHHRLLETYLSQILGLEWDQVHDEADRLEHVISEEVEARMDAALGHPLRDPHGSPIPSRDGTIAHDNEKRLSEAVSGDLLVVARVIDESAELLRHLSEVGLRPDADIEVLRAQPAEGVLQLRINGQSQIVGEAPARAVFVVER
jgi:DtxR family Mn-dependent transcriptional regulator